MAETNLLNTVHIDSPLTSSYARNTVLDCVDWLWPGLHKLIVWVIKLLIFTSGVARWFIFKPKPSNLGEFWRVLQWKMLAHFMVI
jgi:hypothetical protein